MVTETIVNTRLTDEVEKIFLLTKEEFGFSSNSETIRFIINRFWKYYKEERPFLEEMRGELKELKMKNEKINELLIKMDKEKGMNE